MLANSYVRDRSIAGALSRPRVALLLAIAFQIGVFFALQGDAPPSDSLAYAENAHAIATDPAAFFRTPSNHPFVMRVGITVPLAVIYRVLGVSTWTTNLPCLIAAIAILLVVYAAAPTARAKWVGLWFAASSTLLAHHGSELDADFLCGAATAVSILLLSRRRGSAGWIAGAVVMWFVAFLIKETTIWVAPAWIYAIAVDMRDLGWRRAVRRFAPALGLGLGLGLLYLTVCAWVWGDPMARATGINALAGAHPWAPHGQPAEWWLRRLTLQPPRAFIGAFGAALVVAVVGAHRITGASRLWTVATISCLLMLWLGSASSDEYVPLPLEQRRMLTVTLPGVLVLAALASERLRWSRRWIALVVIATALPQAWLIGLRSRRERPEMALHRALRDEVVDGRDVVVVCPTVRCLQVIPFHFGFRPPANVRVRFVTEFARAPAPTGERVCVVVDPPRERAGSAGGVSLSESIETLGLRPVFWHRAQRLYDAGDGGSLHAALGSRIPP